MVWRSLHNNKLLKVGLKVGMEYKNVAFIQCIFKKWKVFAVFSAKL